MHVPNAGSILGNRSHWVSGLKHNLVTDKLFKKLPRSLSLSGRDAKKWLDASCSAKLKVSFRLLVKYAGTAFWICTIWVWVATGIESPEALRLSNYNIRSNLYTAFEELIYHYSHSTKSSYICFMQIFAYSSQFF